jgi:SnoaL-like domain
MDRDTFRSWLDSYGRAWIDRNPEAAAALYTDTGTYQVTPFLEPMRGRRAIFDYWAEVARTEEGIRFEHEILAVDGDRGIATWWAAFVRVPPGLATKLDGIFLITLDGEGRCVSLREWWHKQQ